MSHIGTYRSDDRKDEGIEIAMQLSTSFIVPIMFNTVIQLELLEIIAEKKEITPSRLASHLGAKNKNAAAMLDCLLRLLTSYSILECSLSDDEEPELLYQLAPSGEVYVQDVQKGRPYSLTSYLPFNRVMQPTDYGYHIKDAILEGGGTATERAYGMHLFEWYTLHPEFGKRFDLGMRAQSGIISERILDTYKGFSGIKSLVDVGGGDGTNLNLIALKYPSIKCINFDLPYVIKEAPPLVGVEQIAGDMFVALPESETILLKFVCHNWDDEHVVKILKKCYQALPKNGKVILIEIILPVIPSTSIADKYVSQVDNIMLSIHGSRERNLAQFEALSKAAGFSKIQIQCQVLCMIGVVEIYK